MHFNRIATIDVARGFTVFIMPAVHSVVLYSSLQVHQSILGAGLRFLAEGPGAQLFLLLMGLSVSLSRAKNHSQILKRSLSLFAIAFLLNYVRLVVPILLNLIPRDFLTDLAIADNDTGKLNAFFMGDILQTAALGYLVCSLLFKLKYFQWWAAGLILLIILTPLLWQTNASSSLWTFKYLLTGSPPITFFPVFPWIVYPLSGLLAGWYLREYPTLFYYILFFAGGCMLLTGQIIMSYEPAAWNINFYTPGPGAIIYHLGIVALWMVLCNILVIYLPDNLLFDLLKWLSKHITLIYFVQWIVVLWLFPLYGFHRLNLLPSILALTLNSLISFALTFASVEFKTRYLRKPASLL